VKACNLSFDEIEENMFLQLQELEEIKLKTYGKL